MIAQAIQIGHLHPLVVHLPIGILLLGFILEVVYRKKPSEVGKEIILMVLLIGAISAIVSLGTGWLLGENGGYDETLLFRHRWLAVAFTVLAIGLYLLKKATHAMAQKFYFPVYVLVLILIGITGHYGGSMTHGEDYLFTDSSIKKVVIEDVNKAQVYADIVQPILDNKCVSCHNPSKIKGGLLMNTKENLLAGGDSGNILDSVSGKEASHFMQRLHLPLVDEDHMPPKGKVQPTADELALLAWWMNNDHCFDCVVANLEKTDKMGDILIGLEEDRSPRALMARNLKPVPKDWIAQLNHSDITTYPLAEGNPLLQVSLNGRQDVGQSDFKALKKYAKHVVELNLGNTNFNDTLSKSLSSFKNLTKLQLQNAPITDTTIENLKGLEHLESLNLYGDSISDKALSMLGGLKNLKNIYLWQTNISEEALNQYALDHPNIRVQGQIDSEIFKATKLEPPTIVADRDFFRDSLQLELDYVFDDASIFYTLDGSEPDSTSSKYTTPITLTQSAEVKAVTYAPGWQLSEVTASNFKKIAFDIKAIALNKNPNDRYKGHGAKTLFDQKRGTINFVDGNWIGYENSHFTATIQLGAEQLISSVAVGALSSPEKWIFYPTGFIVWVSDNGVDFRLVKRQSVGSEKINTLTRFRFFDLDIPPSKAKYVKVQVKSQLKNPSWHPNPGGNSWLFVDEIVLN
jgi:uncharacterized membrane protein